MKLIHTPAKKKKRPRYSQVVTVEHNPRNNMPLLQKSLTITRLSKSVLQNRTWILEFIIIFLSVASRAPADGGPAPRTPL